MRADTEAWLASAESDAAAARLLLDGGFFMQTVFYTHLSLEKTLKAMVAELSPLGVVPHSHDLMRLLRLTPVDPPLWLVSFLGTLAIQSTSARYTLPPQSSVYTAELARGLLEESYEATTWLSQQLT